MMCADRQGLRIWILDDKQNGCERKTRAWDIKAATVHFKANASRWKQTVRNNHIFTFVRHYFGWILWSAAAFMLLSFKMNGSVINLNTQCLPVKLCQPSLSRKVCPFLISSKH